MAKVFYRPACDAALLSAYRDEALDPPRRRALELHLEACPACRQELLQYERLSFRLSHLALEPRRQPISHDLHRLATTAASRPARSLRATGTLVSVSLAAVLVVVALFHGAPQRPPALFAAYPPSGASNVSTDTAILITFQHPVDQAQVQQTLQFEPQVPFDISWQSWKQAEIVPLTPLAASTTYTLLATVPPWPTATVAAAASPSPTASLGLTPQAITVFHTARRTAAEGGPAPVVPRMDVFSQSQPVSITQPVLAVPATPTPVSLPSAAPSALAALQPAMLPAGQHAASAADALADTLQQPAMLPPCAPANVFTPIYSSRADIRSALGCVDGTVRTTTLISQSFQRGVLLAVVPDGMLYELTTDGIWRATPFGAGGDSRSAPEADSAIGPTFRAYWSGHPMLRSSLGLPLAVEAGSQALLQRFAHGFMLSATGWTYIADDAGQWQRLVSMLPGDEGTPSNPGGAITGGVPSFPPLRLASASNGPERR